MRLFFVLISLAVSGLVSGPLLAAEVIDTFGDWTAFTDKEGGHPLCYAGSEPKKSEGKYKKRDEDKHPEIEAKEHVIDLLIIAGKRITDPAWLQQIVRELIAVYGNPKQHGEVYDPGWAKPDPDPDWNEKDQIRERDDPLLA